MTYKISVLIRSTIILWFDLTVLAFSSTTDLVETVQIKVETTYIDENKTNFESKD